MASSSLRRATQKDAGPLGCGSASARLSQLSHHGGAVTLGVGDTNRKINSIRIRESITRFRLTRHWSSYWAATSWRMWTTCFHQATNPSPTDRCDWLARRCDSVCTVTARCPSQARAPVGLERIESLLSWVDGPTLSQRPPAPLGGPRSANWPLDNRSRQTIDERFNQHRAITVDFNPVVPDLLGGPRQHMAGEIRHVNPRKASKTDHCATPMAGASSGASRPSQSSDLWGPAPRRPRPKTADSPAGTAGQPISPDPAGPRSGGL